MIWEKKVTGNSKMSRLLLKPQETLNKDPKVSEVYVFKVIIMIINYNYL